MIIIFLGSSGMHGITNKLTLGKGHHFFQSFGWQAHGVPTPWPCADDVAPPTNALGPLGCFKRCHCIGVLAAPPACLACMWPLRLGLQPVSSFTAERQLVGLVVAFFGKQTTMGRFVRWQQLVVGMWHVWGVHTGTCIVGCRLKQPAMPPTRHRTPIKIFCLFRKKAGLFLALQAIN